MRIFILLPERSGGERYSVSVPYVCDAMDKRKFGIGWNRIHANYIKNSGLSFCNLLCKFFNKILGHTIFSNPVFCYEPILNSSMFFKVFEFMLLPYLERYIKIDSRQFAYRTNTGCLTAVTVPKETVVKYVAQGSSVYCATVDLSKAYDRFNIVRFIRELQCSY